MENKRRIRRIRRRVRVTLAGTSAAYTADLSPGGFCVMTMKVVKPGVQVSGTITIGSTDYPFIGEVCWARAGEPRLNQAGKMGVRFVNVPNDFFSAYTKAYVNE